MGDAWAFSYFPPDRPTLKALNSPISQTTYRPPKVYGSPAMAMFDPTSFDAEGSTGDVKGKGKGREKERGYLRVRITGLERNRKDLLIRFDASTDLPQFRTGMYRNMQRSYIEFQKFAEQAQLTSPQTIIPALPPASTSATTDEEGMSISIYTAQEERESAENIDRSGRVRRGRANRLDDRLVRISIQRWITRICEDPALQADEELRSFIESDFGYSPTPPMTARRQASSAVPSVLTAAISKVVRRGPLDSDDELSSARGALEKLEGTWNGAALAINNLSKVRRAHAIANQDVGTKLINLSTVESDQYLSAAERKIGRGLETLSGLSGTQCINENIVLGDTLSYQSLNARAAKEALIQRSQLLEDAQTSSKTSIQKRRTLERLKGSSSINPGKVDDAISEMETAESLESTLNQQLINISSNLHLSLRGHSRYTHQDVALALLENARFNVGWHKRVLGELEACRPELSRVGGIAEGQGQSSRSITGINGKTPISPPLSQGLLGGGGGVQPRMNPSRPYDSSLSTSLPQPPPPQQQQQRTSARDFGQGSQSMFLPPPPSSSNPSAASSSTYPTSVNRDQPPRPSGSGQNQSIDPLGGHMTQSMVLPPSNRQGTTGRNGGKRLDERQAAKLLAGGF